MSFHDLEEDYESIYTFGHRPDPCTGASIPVGLCRNMCSKSERVERKKSRRIITRFETSEGVSDDNLMIAEFKRSSAGHGLAVSENLRPWTVLRHTLHHLLLNICSKNDEWMYICDFVYDRLRAIRQEMVIQRIEGRRYIEVLEGSIRFSVYSLYRLSCTLRDYSHHEPMKKIVPDTGPVKGFDGYEMNVIRDMKLTMQSVRDCLQSLIVQYQDNVPDSMNRPIFEAVNLLVNLPFIHGCTHLNTEFLTRGELRNSNPIFLIAFKIYCDHLVGNHRSALERLPELIEQPLLVMAYASVVGLLQFNMVQMFVKLYSSPGPNKSSVKHLCALICPEWLETNEKERNLFAKFIATQFGIYDDQNNSCDFSNRKTLKRVLPRDFVEKAEFERLVKESKKVDPCDSETGLFARQMIFGREWSFYRNVIKKHGVKHILDPSQDNP